MKLRWTIKFEKRYRVCSITDAGYAEVYGRGHDPILFDTRKEAQAVINHPEQERDRHLFTIVARRVP